MGMSHDQPHSTRVIVLVGLMGSGKSSVGRRLANAMRVNFYDTDEMVAAATRKSVRELFAENRTDIEHRADAVVWLDADIDELVARTSSGTHRPLLDGGARGKLEEMQQERRSLYESLATLRVSTKGRSLASITEHIVAQLGSIA